VLISPGSTGSSHFLADQVILDNDQIAAGALVRKPRPTRHPAPVQ
jgi:hypothetical protein